MLAAAIIVFREMLEAGLVVGIVLAVTRSLPKAKRWIGAGVAAGVLGACVVALFTDALSAAFAGAGEELFNAAILALAVMMLAWHNIWMAQHGREMAAELRSAGKSVASGAKAPIALAIVVGVAILREGSEVVLFLYGIAISHNNSILDISLGAMLGLALGAGVSVLTFLGLVKIPVRLLFSVTGWLIALLAAGMAAQCVAFLEQGGFVSVLGATGWDTSMVVSQGSILGRIAHALVGYVDRPSVLQILVYGLTLFGIVGFSRLVAARAKAPAPPPQQGSIDDASGVRTVKREGGNLDVKGLAIRVDH